MSHSKLPRDTFGNPVQALQPDPAGAVAGSVASSSARITLTAATELVRIAASTACYIKFGDNTVAATTSDTFFPAGVEIFAVPESAPGVPYTHLAFIRQTSDGVITATRMN